MNNIFLTGEKRIGKSTILKECLELLKRNTNKEIKLGGYECCKNTIYDKDKTIVTHSLMSLNDYSYYKIIEFITSKDIHDIKKFPNHFNDYAPTLNNDLENCDLIILDEVGFAESNAPKYLKVLKNVLDSEIPVFGVLKKHDCDLINNIKKRDDITLFTINKENRNSICKDIYKVLVSNL